MQYFRISWVYAVINLGHTNVCTVKNRCKFSFILCMYDENQLQVASEFACTYVILKNYVSSFGPTYSPWRMNMLIFYEKSLNYITTSSIVRPDIFICFRKNFNNDLC